MNDTQRLEQAVLDLTEMMDSLFSEIKTLKESNFELSGKLRILSEQIDTLE